MSNDIWLRVNDYPDYMVSNSGNIINTDSRGRGKAVLSTKWLRKQKRKSQGKLQFQRRQKYLLKLILCKQKNLSSRPGGFL